MYRFIRYDIKSYSLVQQFKVVDELPRSHEFRYLLSLDNLVSILTRMVSQLFGEEIVEPKLKVKHLDGFIRHITRCIYRGCRTNYIIDQMSHVKAKYIIRIINMLALLDQELAIRILNDPEDDREMRAIILEQIIDHDIFYLSYVISMYRSGSLLFDIDMLSALQEDTLKYLVELDGIANINKSNLHQAIVKKQIHCPKILEHLLPYTRELGIIAHYKIYQTPLLSHPDYSIKATNYHVRKWWNKDIVEEHTVEDLVCNLCIAISVAIDTGRKFTSDKFETMVNNSKVVSKDDILQYPELKRLYLDIINKENTSHHTFRFFSFK